MVKRFTVWMEDLFQKKRLMNILADRLGYDKDAIEHDVMMTDRKIPDIIDAIEKLPIGEDNKQMMISFVKTNHHGLSLKALASKINPEDAEQQDTASSMPASLPPGTQPAPKPVNPQQQQMQQQQQPMPGMM